MIFEEGLDQRRSLELVQSKGGTKLLRQRHLDAVRPSNWPHVHLAARTSQISLAPAPLGRAAPCLRRLLDVADMADGSGGPIR